MAEVKRQVVYTQNGPVLQIRAKNERGAPALFAIRMQDLWQYTPEKNPNYELWMYRVCEKIHELLDLGVLTTKKMAEIAGVIEDGIEELLAAPPEDPNKAIGPSMAERFEIAGIEQTGDNAMSATVMER